MAPELNQNFKDHGNLNKDYCGTELGQNASSREDL